MVNQFVPVRILSYLAQQVQAKSNDFDFYLKGAKSTRSNHFREIQAHYQFQSFVEGLQKEGIELSEQHLKHFGPLGWEHITLTGEYFWNSSQWTSLENLRPIQLRPELFKS